jgi:IstB-like ATP binding protein
VPEADRVDARDGRSIARRHSGRPHLPGSGGPIEPRHQTLEALSVGGTGSIFDLVRELLSQETQASEGRLLKKYLKPDLLIIDDMGLKILPQKSGEILLEIIMRRYENRSTMMTSNRPIEEWGKLLSDVPAASAILDRLLHHAEIIPINGRSYRLQPKPKRAADSERSASSSSNPNPA